MLINNNRLILNILISEEQKKEIEKTYKDFCMKQQSMPTRTEIAKQLNLELETIDEYHNSLADDVIDAASPFKVFFTDVMQKQVLKALQGDTKAAEFYLKAVYAFDGKAPEKAPVQKIKIKITNALDT